MLTSAYRVQGVQLFAADMGISIPQATYAVTAYAVATIAGSPLGTFLGQQAGRQALYAVVAVIGLAAGLAILRWVPTTADLDGGPIAQEPGALRRPMLTVPRLAPPGRVQTAAAA